MKKLTLSLLALLMSFMSGLAVVGSDPSGSNCNEKTRLVHRHDKQSDPSRPNLPSRLYITCEYSPINISFIFPTDIEWLNVALGDEMFPVWEGFIQ